MNASMLIYFSIVLAENLFRLSYFYDPSIKLINNKSNLVTAFIHAHGDSKFFFKLQEASPGEIKIVATNRTVLSSEKDGNLTFKEDEDDKTQVFNIKMSPEGGVKIVQKDRCLTIVENTKLVMKPCQFGKDQIFVLIKSTNEGIIKLYNGLALTYKTTKYPKEH